MMERLMLVLFVAQYCSLAVGARLACHLRNRILSVGETLSDDHSSVACSVGEICGRIVVEGTSRQHPSLEITTEISKCLSRNVCGDIRNACATVRPSLPMNVRSCDVTCCDEDMCDGSTDAPHVPNSLVPEGRRTYTAPVHPRSSNQAPILLCHRSATLNMRGKITNSRPFIQRCPGGVCGSFRYEGTTNEQYASGVTRICTTPSMCNVKSCLLVPDGKDILIRSCKVICCKKNLCNQDIKIVPTVPTLHCYRQVEVNIGQMKTRGTRFTVQVCHQGEVCAAFAFEGKSGGEYALGYSHVCAKKSQCDNVVCSEIPGANAVSVERCSAVCCGTNICNRNRAILTESEDILHCYNIQIIINGTNTIVKEEKPEKCVNRNMKCLRMEATGTDNSMRNTMMLTYGSCIEKNVCGVLDCGMLRSMVPEVGGVTSCDAACCGRDLCNDATLSAGKQKKGFASRCYNILSTSIGKKTLLDRKSFAWCGRFDRCFRIRAMYNSSGDEVTVRYGGCIFKDFCQSLNCSLLDGIVPNGGTLKHCMAWCCNKELCNIRDILLQSRAGLPKKLKCYDIHTTREDDAEIDQRATRKVECEEPENKCLRFDAELVPVLSATRTEKRVRAVSFTFGRCATPLTCANLNCEKMFPANPGLKLLRCGAKCCDTDNCNVTPAPWKNTALSGRSSIGEVASRGGPIRCYRVAEMRANGMLLPEGRRGEERCEVGSECLRISATADHASMPGALVAISYGACVSEEACHNIDCDYLTNAGLSDGLAIKHCDSSCCDWDLCNG